MFKFLSNLLGLKEAIPSNKIHPNPSPIQPNGKFSNSLYSKVAGVTFNNRQALISKCYSGQELTLIREKSNTYDKNAIAIYANSKHLGYINKNLANQLAPKIDAGILYKCYVSEVTGGYDKNYGLNIILKY